MTERRLTVSDVTKRFAGLVAVEAVSLEAVTGEVLGVIGPNGAGKSTLFALISGSVSATSGAIEFDGRDITGLPVHQVAETGVVRTFQEVNLFEGLSVLENVLVGSHLPHCAGVLTAMLPSRGNRRKDRAREKHARATLGRLGLEDIADHPVTGLSLGHKRILNVAIALAANPSLILLDEPLAGLAPTEQRAVLDVISQLRDEDLGVILVEHNVRAVMAIADRVAVLNFGRKIAEGSPADVQRDPTVQEVYLGTAQEPA